MKTKITLKGRECHNLRLFHLLTLTRIMDSFDKFKDTHMDSFENFKDNLEQQEHVPNVPAGPTSGNER